MIDQQSQAITRTAKEAEKITQVALDSYNDARKALAKEIDKLFSVSLADLDPADRYNYMLKSNRLDSLLKAVDAQYAAYSRDAGKKIAGAVSLGTTNAYYRDQYVLDWFTPVGGVGIDYTPLPPALAEVISTGNTTEWRKLSKKVRDRITATFGEIDQYVPEAGTLSSLLADSRRKEIAQINRTITSGLIRGQGARQIARGISGVIGKVTGQGSTGAMANALRIARTETVRSMNAGAYANSQAVNAQGVNNQKIWISTLDLRTRDSHGNLDGTIKELNQKFVGSNGSGLRPGAMSSASENINCRCRLADVIDGVPPEIRRGINPETGESELFEWKTFEDWKKSNNLKTGPAGKITPKPKPKPKPAAAAPKAPTAKAPTAKAPTKWGRVESPLTPAELAAPSKSLAAAARKAKKAIPGLKTASFSGLNLQTADEVIRALVQQQAVYGDFDIQHIKATTSKKYAMAATWAGTAGNYEKTLMINRANFGDKFSFKQITESIKKSQESGWTAGATVGEVVLHEMGHFMEYREMGPGRDGLIAAVAQSKIFDNPALAAKWGQGISQYANASGSEAIAEGLVRYHQGAKINPHLSAAMEKYIGVDVFVPPEKVK